METMRFVGKVVIVTGASSGIGRSTAKMFCREGATVIAAARRMKRLEKVKQDCIDEGCAGTIFPIKVDVRDPAQIDMMFDTALKEFGTIDVLVNNAGVLDGHRPVHEVTDEIYDHIYETNQKAVFLCCRRAVRIFLEQGKKGNIVNVASAASLRGLKGGCMYITTKHAVLGITRNISASYYERGIRCNCIEPSNIKTEVNRVPHDLGYEIPEWTDRAYKAAPLHTITKPGEKMPTLGSPKDCAYLICFLADDVQAKYISGAEVKIDAGWLNM